MATRSIAVSAAIAAGAALVATGITYASAASEPAQASAVAQPAAAPAALQGSNGNGNNNNGKDDNDRDDHDGYGYGGYGFDEGRIHVNERDFSAAPGGCITVISGLGSDSFNIRNDSKRTVEFFNGVTCDNGAPIAIVGPHSQSDGVFPRRVRGGVRVRHGVVGSFRVVGGHFEHFEHREHEGK